MMKVIQSAGWFLQFKRRFPAPQFLAIQKANTSEPIYTGV